jgi:hypothetical protein
MEERAREREIKWKSEEDAETDPRKKESLVRRHEHMRKENEDLFSRGGRRTSGTRRSKTRRSKTRRSKTRRRVQYKKRKTQNKRRTVRRR